MTKLRVHNVTITLDGYATGTGQRLDAPFGDGVDGLHDWMFAGAEGLDSDRIAMMDEGIGATIMGRNMFGPHRGPWEDHTWTGWWGPNPPYHNDVFVMTHHLRPTLTMEGGTTFHFVDAGPEEVLTQATKAADGKDVLLAGGASVVRQFVEAGLVDEMYLVIAPLIAGAGERLFDGPGWTGFEVAELTSSTAATHIHLTRRTS